MNLLMDFTQNLTIKLILVQLVKVSKFSGLLWVLDSGLI